MIACRRFTVLGCILLTLLICLAGCDPAKEAPQKKAPPPQTASQKRAPRTLAAFQKAIADGHIGTISGRARLNGDPPPREVASVTLNRSVCGHEQQSQDLLTSENGGIRNVVLSLLKIPRGLATEPTEEPLKLDQRQCVFIPHVLIAPADTEFLILNSDPVLHNFHAIGASNKEINIMQTRTRRRQLPVKYTEPDTVQVTCDVHSWMRSWIIVAAHPYYTLTDAAGQFYLENVPEGSYQIKAWHEKLGEQIQEIVVTTNQDTTIDFSFSRP